jgi:hypothetical protein
VELYQFFRLNFWRNGIRIGSCFRSLLCFIIGMARGINLNNIFVKIKWKENVTIIVPCFFWLVLLMHSKIKLMTFTKSLGYPATLQSLMVHREKQNIVSYPTKTFPNHYEYWFMLRNPGIMVLWSKLKMSFPSVRLKQMLQRNSEGKTASFWQPGFWYWRQGSKYI